MNDDKNTSGNPDGPTPDAPCDSATPSPEPQSATRGNERLLAGRKPAKHELRSAIADDNPAKGVDPSSGREASEHMSFALVGKLRPLYDGAPIEKRMQRLLEEDIRESGLRQPLLVDLAAKFLIAGAHRREAVLALHAADPDALASVMPHGVPVIRTDYAAADDMTRALLDSITENGLRRKVGRAEITTLMKELIKGGRVPKRGAPRDGEEPVLPMLARKFGRSRATIKRYLAAARDEGAPPPAPALRLTSVARVVCKWRSMIHTSDAPDATKLRELLDLLATELTAQESRAPCAKGDAREDEDEDEDEEGEPLELADDDGDVVECVEAPAVEPTKRQRTKHYPAR